MTTIKKYIYDIKWNIQTLINIKLVLLFKHKLMS